MNEPGRDQQESNPYKGPGGPGRLIGALRNSANGLHQAWSNETAFRQEVVVFALMLPVALLAPVAPIERLLLVGSMALVLIAELLNSAIEAIVDRVSLERHPLSKRSKDAASAAVLLALLLAVATWATIWYPVLMPAD